MASPGTKIIKGKYVSAWGGIQSAGQTIGQIIALYVIWVVLVVLFAGMGVGMLQSTLPLYLAEISPTQLKGLFINAYTFWFVLGQLFASVALNRLHLSAPYDFRTPIYSQWAMIGVSAIIFVFLPETPWYLVSKGKLDQAKKVLTKMHGRKQGYDSQEQVDLMMSTIASERAAAEQNSELGPWAVFQGKNLLRFIIAAWPKITQQLVGLTVFNTYATYFFQKAGNKDPFLVTLILSCVQLISMIMTAISTDKLGRRPLTVYPYAITVLSLLSLGIVGCFDYSKPALSSLLIFFACLATFSTTGASAIGYAYAAEIPQQRLRARTTAFALAFSNMVAIMFSFTTPLMINGDAQWGVKTGFFFAGTGAVAVVICWFILPEVACRTPAEIDEMFEKKINLRKFKQYSPSNY
ncbi:general substrate transporter [Aureobasidium pullulans]|uniref:General substrate transporter n=1 Tax=Aureobasidium pullulans TaxID=5580 RepID=A0A4V4LA68_AURPU|nr:general substrate transporter [Aureobasidium pullulans]TIA19487.1 general substrate transporter [Aureobasidium pullulans]